MWIILKLMSYEWGGRMYWIKMARAKVQYLAIFNKCFQVQYKWLVV